MQPSVSRDPAQRHPLPYLCCVLAGCVLGVLLRLFPSPEPLDYRQPAHAAEPDAGPQWRPFGATRAWVSTRDGVTSELAPGSSCRWEGNKPGQVMVLEDDTPGR
jgi:hypothetical protein